MSSPSPRPARLVLLSAVLLGCADGGGGPPVAAALPAAFAAPPEAGADPGEPAVGINLSRVAFFSAEWVFVDLMRSAHRPPEDRYPWMLEDAGLAPPALDERGYPRGLGRGQSVTTVCARGLGGHYPGGRYTLRFRGSGTVEVGGDTKWARHDHDGEGVAEIEVPVTPTNQGLTLKIVASDPADHVRDVELIMPGFAGRHEREPFHPTFLSSLAPFSVLRFMDWGETNHSRVERWEDRPRPDDRTQFRGGVAPEYMIELCNRLQKHAWVCIPHAADDDYVRRLSQLFGERLDPGLRLYVEYSNEVWNGIFGQHRWVKERAERRGEPWHATYVRRTVEVVGIAREVLGRERVVGVLAGHGDNAWLNRKLLEALPSDDAVDAFAVAPYFGGRLGRKDAWRATRGWSVEQLLDACQEDIQTRVRELIRENAAAAAGRGLPLVAYEGGQHLVAVGGQAKQDEQLCGLFERANRHPRMGQLYREYLAVWAEEGGGLFCAFSSVYRPNQHGCWGAREYQDQTDAPKYEALADVARRWSGSGGAVQPAGR